MEEEYMVLGINSVFEIKFDGDVVQVFPIQEFR